MVTVANRAQRILESMRKIESPFVLDETLCLYSPQDNVDALAHPRIVDWLRFIQHDYAPKLPKASHRVLLLMPCTKTKPYPFSSEHKHINQRLIETGFRPSAPLFLPHQLQAQLEEEFSPAVLNLSPLISDQGTVVHRVVISEPLALVPYECIVAYESKPSLSTAYDDPGLFENRGNAVSPWQADCTATAVSATRWHWETRSAAITCSCTTPWPRRSPAPYGASPSTTPTSCRGWRRVLPTAASFSPATSVLPTTSARRAASGQCGSI
jgi:hypothetical protein